MASNHGMNSNHSSILDEILSHTDGSGVVLAEHLDKSKAKELFDNLKESGIDIPTDVNGEPIFSLKFIKSLPPSIQPRAAEIVREILSIFNENGTRKLSRLTDDVSNEDDGKSNRFSNEIRVKLEDVILGLRYTPEGFSYVTDDKGLRVEYERMLVCLKNAYSESELKRHDEANREKEANLKAAIREEKRQEDKDPELKKAGSDLEMQQMAMRFIPEYNPRPDKRDPINLFEHAPKPLDTHTHGSGAQHKGVEFIHLLEPSFPIGRMDSLATLPSTVARRFSNDSVRGSALSTRLSDMPSMFSQALVEEPSQAFVMTASTQEFNINPKSVSDYREKWLISFMSGFTPKQTFTICILNMITRKRTELREFPITCHKSCNSHESIAVVVEKDCILHIQIFHQVCKENTMNEICHMFMQYDDHPEYYVWKDIYGRVLIPEKTLVENGLLRQDEILEFQGYRRLPVILLYFRDGFENDPPLPLNPLHALKQREPGLCRNY